MNKEEAIEVYKELTNEKIKEAFEFFAPELKESKDERIRESLINYINYHGNAGDFTKQEFIAWLEKQGKPQDKGEISDGYHTFNELYYYRMLYNAAFFNMLPKEWVHKSKKHHDGEECFGGGWFIVMAYLPTGQISNHYELKDWNLFQIPEKEFADEWDGHTPQEAADRLHKYLLEKQGEQKPTWSEEDEKMIDLLIAIFRVNYPNEFYKTNPANTPNMGSKHSLEIINWLKSIKERMKGE